MKFSHELTKKPELSFGPRGIEPALLVSQIKNTMPYIADHPELEFEGARLVGPLVHATTELHHSDLTHFEYFRLCLSAHYMTCATPVPTDVDNQIRFKLWSPQLMPETAIEMATLVLESRYWNFKSVSRRYTETDLDNGVSVLSGNLGEWFTVATAAYCALQKYGLHIQQQQLFEAIESEVQHHARHFGALMKVKDGKQCLIASANIAHNLGDLDRVMDQWELEPLDALRLRFYKLGSSPFDVHGKLRYEGRLWIAGELYKSLLKTGSQKVTDASSMALENHRHFALRKPRVIRSSAKYLVPNGPFFDDWGKLIGRVAEVQDVVEALIYGWKKLPKTVGYGRALKGILEAGLIQEDSVFSTLSKPQRQIVQLSQERFEKQWCDQALFWIDEIPSRA